MYGEGATVQCTQRVLQACAIELNMDTVVLIGDTVVLIGDTVVLIGDTVVLIGDTAFQGTHNAHTEWTVLMQNYFYHLFCVNCNTKCLFICLPS